METETVGFVVFVLAVLVGIVFASPPVLWWIARCRGKTDLDFVEWQKRRIG